MGFETESEGEVLPELGIVDAGDFFAGADVLSDAVLGNWEAGNDGFEEAGRVPVPSLFPDSGDEAGQNFHDDAKPADSRTRERRLLLAGLVLSLALHVVLGGVLATFEPPVHEPPTPEVVAIRLLPVNPLLEQTAEPEQVPVDESAIDEMEAIAVIEEPVPEVAELLAEESIPEPVQEVESPVEQATDAELAQAEEATAESDFPDSPPVAEPPIVVIPSRDIVTRSIQSVEAENTSRLWAYDCNAQQQESELIRCDDQATPNYDRVRENSTYRSLNPVRVLSRSQRTLPTITENSSALAGRLQDINIPEGLSDYLMEEVEAGISHNTNAGNRALENIEMMTDKSDAAKIARDVLGNPWVETQSRSNAQRRVAPR